MSRTRTLRKTRAEARQPTKGVAPPKKEPFFSGNKLNVLLAVLLAVATQALYSPALQNGFLMWDDQDYVRGNSHIHHGLTRHTVKWAFTSTYAANWHPLTWLSHALDYQLFGLHPWGHHLDSVLLHSLNTALLFGLLAWMTRRTGPSLLVAALFAVHPLNVESVAWIAERKNLLSTLFFFLAIGAYVWYAQKPNWRRYLLVAALFAAGLMAKPMVITLPFVLLLLDYWPLGRIALRFSPFALRQSESHLPSGEKRIANSEEQFSGEERFVRLLLEKVPLLVLSAASAWITLRAQRGSVRSFAEIGPAVRTENALVAYVLYVWKTLWPARLSALYPHPTNLLPAWQVVLSALFLLAVVALVVIFRRKGYLPVGWLWFLGTLVPVIGLVQVGEAAMADRYAYLPLIGIFIMIAWGVDDWADANRVPILWRAIPALAVVIALGFCTSLQMRYWESDYTLWEHAVAASEDNPNAQQSLADALVSPEQSMSAKDLQRLDTEQKRLDSASQHYEAALQIYQRLAQENPTAYLGREAGVLNNLGNAARMQNRIDEAGQRFAEAFAIYRPLAQQNPETYQPDLAMTLNNLGSVAILQNRPDEGYDREEAALNMYRQLAHQDPDKYQRGVFGASTNLAFLAHTANNLGNLAMQRSRLDQARADYELALRICRQLISEGFAQCLPELANALLGLGFLERAEKRPDKARSYFEETTAIDRQLAMLDPQKYLPALASRQLNLGNFYTEQNQLELARPNYEAAVQTYRQLAQQSPDTYLGDLAGTLTNLALVDQLEKRLAESRANYTEALAIYRKLAQGNPGNYANNVARLETSLRELGSKPASR